VEAGQLESEVVTMVGSVRRWGGPLANVPVIAVTPRFGPPLTRSTHRAFRDLGVRHVVSVKRNDYSWNGFMNKPLTLQIAAPLIQTTHGLWLDGDTLVVAPPDELFAQDEKLFMACVEEIGPVSDGPGNKFDSFWVAIGNAMGWPESELPWVMAPLAGQRIRAYCNSGVFRYRMNCGLEDAYEHAFRVLLDSHLIARDDPSIFVHEQIALGQVAAKDFGFYELPMEYNFHAGEGYEYLYPRSEFGKSRIVHYHRVMRTTETRDHFLRLLDEYRPDVADFVRKCPSGRDPRPRLLRAPSKALRWLRERSERRHMAKCVKV
jgi:hypothetical protein